MICSYVLELEEETSSNPFPVDWFLGTVSLIKSVFISDPFRDLNSCLVLILHVWFYEVILWSLFVAFVQVMKSTQDIVYFIEVCL